MEKMKDLNRIFLHEFLS